MASPSPFAARFARSQSGMKLPLVSVHTRLTELIDVLIGLLALVTVGTATFDTYRPNATFSAVRPSPNRSYAAPRRGSTSFHDGTSFTSPNDRSGPQPFGGAGAGG